MYRENNVLEYLVWRVLDRAIDWFVLRGDQYEPVPPPADGLSRSTIFPGLWLDAAALMDGNLPQVLQAVQRGVATPEHQNFVKDLASRTGRPD